MLNNSSNPIPLPKEIDAEIDKARQQLIVSQQELLNTRKARHSEEVFISQITGMKESLKNEVVELQEKVDNLSKKKTTIEEEMTSINNKNKKLLIINSEIEENARKNKIESEKMTEEAINIRKEIEVRESDLKEREIEFEVKDKKLREFLRETDKIIKNYGSN
jgi:chromosome segregation ATPase